MEEDGFGYVYTDEVKERLKKKFKNFRPSIFQKLFWLVWPTLTSIEWRRYKAIRKTE